MLSSLLLLVHRRCSPPSLQPHRCHQFPEPKVPVVQSHPTNAHAWFTSLGQEVPHLPCDQRQRRRTFPNSIQLPHLTPIFRINQCPGTRDRVSRHLRLHAKDSTVLRTLRAYGQISRPERTQGVPPSDHILHWSVSTLARPRTLLR